MTQARQLAVAEGTAVNKRLAARLGKNRNQGRKAPTFDGVVLHHSSARMIEAGLSFHLIAPAPDKYDFGCCVRV